MSNRVKSRFRILFTIAARLFGRKPTNVTVVVEWLELPYDFKTDFFELGPTVEKLHGSRKTLVRGRRVKPLSPR